jgi:hypothetical protein
MRKGLGLVPAFLGQRPSPSGGKNFTALGSGARGGGARRSRQRRPPHWGRFHTKRHRPSIFSHEEQDIYLKFLWWMPFRTKGSLEISQTSRHLVGSRRNILLYVVSCRTGRWPPPTAEVSRRSRAAVLPAFRLRTRSRAGGARRSVPLRASETPICERAWGWLRLFAASARARPAARTSPPSRAGPGGGGRRALQRHPPHRGGSTRNDLIRNI